MHVGVRRLTLRATQCHSLKDKRAVLRKLDAQVRARFHLPLAEVGDQDIWQSIVVGYAVVGSDHRAVERQSAGIAAFIERLGLADLVRDEHEILAYGDGPVGREAQAADRDPSAGFEDWFPEAWAEAAGEPDAGASDEEDVP